jgi:hypothetical protein
VDSEHKWAHASDLKAGMSLKQRDGSTVKIASVEVENLTKPATTYNLEVDHEHDYFAGTKNYRVLVHNECEGDWPPDNGFLGTPKNTLLQVGQTIDRYGGTEFSQFFAPSGLPFALRALPSTFASLPVSTYVVTQQFVVESGLTASWFGQTGLGIQFRSATMTLGELLSQGFLTQVFP